MTKEITPEQFLEALERQRMTPEERVIADAEKAGEAFGKIVAGIIVLFLAPTIIWLVLAYVVGFHVAWAKVFGIFFIFNFVKNLVIRGIRSD